MRQVRISTLGGSALAVAVALFLLTGCALPFVSQSASQLAAGAYASWSKANAFQFKGSLSLKEGTLDFTVTESSQGNQGRGSGRLAGKPFTYLAASSNRYLRGQSFWQAYYTGQQDQQLEARGFEDKYAQAQGNDVAEALQGLTYLGGDLTQLQSDAGSFKKGGQRTIDGRQATALTFGGDTFWVAPGNADQLVGFKAATAGSLRDVNVTIAPAKVPNVRAPGSSVNPLDPSTLPALYQVLDAGNDPSGNCDQNACPIQADIENLGGAPQGAGTVQMTAQEPGTNANIASCTASIPAIATNQTQTVTCTITGSAWNAWATNAASGLGLAFFEVDAQITANPPYVGGS